MPTDTEHARLWNSIERVDDDYRRLSTQVASVDKSVAVIGEGIKGVLERLDRHAAYSLERDKKADERFDKIDSKLTGLGDRVTVIEKNEKLSEGKRLGAGMVASISVAFATVSSAVVGVILRAFWHQ
jgi:hypothetical protein